MSPLKRSNHLAARMGRWSASHWKTALAVWLVFVVGALAIGMRTGTKNIQTQDGNVGQAHKADEILKQAGFTQSDPNTEIVLIQSKTLTIERSEFQSAIKDVARAVAPFELVKNIRTPLDPGHSDLASGDRHTALVEWTI